uniref:C2 domain-containing protein n=1 Tax=Lactuca sativa TaxID=4236 RepID=A0A9R1UFF1_LACSA|nr:hypothetical protein LSAT_V11C900500570 [Lactuca sativa]
MYNNQPSIPSASYHHHQPMANHRIHGNVLEVNVICCYKLKDTEWISRQDPYVCVEYGNNRSRTRTNTDGGKNPTFQEKFVYGMIEGLRELNIMVWNSNILSHDDFIGSGKVQLAKVISHGFDDSSWPLQSKTGRTMQTVMPRQLHHMVHRVHHMSLCTPHHHHHHHHHILPCLIHHHIYPPELILHHLPPIHFHLIPVVIHHHPHTHTRQILILLGHMAIQEGIHHRIEVTAGS